MSLYALLIEDDRSQRDHIGKLECRHNILRLDVGNINTSSLSIPPKLIIIDIQLDHYQNVKHLKELLKKYDQIPSLFLLSKLTNQSLAQAEALGADEVLPYPGQKDPREIRNYKLDALEDSISKYIMKDCRGVWSHIKKEDQIVLDTFGKVNDTINENILNGVPLPKKEITSCCNRLIDNLQNHCILDWLSNVKSHHSYTHRHCLSVTGLAIAFGTYFKMNREELNRLALSALMHDIGKIKIPLIVLDKPERLTEEEIELIRTHPIHSAEILRKDKQFDKEIIDIALHHHELLDGSGYPDGIGGSDIPDSVRMMTIIDIFSALVDERSYKKGLEWDKAYEVMEQMDGQLDMDLLKAFKPIAMNMPDSYSQVSIFSNSLSA